MTDNFQRRSRRCPLCHPEAEQVLWRGRCCRIILVDDEDHAGYCRVIWQAHVKEMTDLASTQRLHLMRVVFAVEHAVRTVMCPDKINLASLGNQVPHLHWHVVPRYRDDASFPDSVWSPAHRSGASRRFDTNRFVRQLRRRLSSAKV